VGSSKQYDVWKKKIWSLILGSFANESSLGFLSIAHQALISQKIPNPFKYLSHRNQGVRNQYKTKKYLSTER
jgi:hypothetical protein